MVGRSGSGQGARAGAAGDRTPRADRGLDHRRYRVSQEGPAFGRGDAAILRPTRQAGQLPGRGHLSRSPTTHASLPIAYRLYLPLEWAAGPGAPGPGRGAGGDRLSRPSPTSRLEQIRAARAAGLPRGRRADGCRLRQRHPAAYRDRRARPALYRRYPAASPRLGRPGVAPLPAKPWSGRRPTAEPAAARPRAPAGRGQGARARPAGSERGRRSLGARASADWLDLAFCQACGCAPPHRDTKRSEPRAEEWLLIEWPPGETEPTKYWFATLPEDIAFERLVDLAKLRWRIERDYQELKQELGLGDYEGRGWRGFHHHATLCIAAYGFLISERGALPPSGPRSATLLPQPGRSRRLPTQRRRRSDPSDISPTRSNSKQDV